MGHNYVGHNHIGHNCTVISDPVEGTAYIVMAYIVGADVVMADVVMANAVMADVVMADVVTADVVMAYIWKKRHGQTGSGRHLGGRAPSLLEAMLRSFRESRTERRSHMYGFNEGLDKGRNDLATCLANGWKDLPSYKGKRLCVIS